MNTKKSNIDILPMLFRAIACGAIITIGAWRVGYGMDFGADFNPMAQRAISVLIMRSEERRVGKECRSRWSPYH